MKNKFIICSKYLNLIINAELKIYNKLQLNNQIYLKSRSFFLIIHFGRN